MVKRVASAVLWLLGVGWGLNFIVAITGASPIVALAGAAAVGTFVGLDPLHLCWPLPTVPPVVPMPDAGTGTVQPQI